MKVAEALELIRRVGAVERSEGNLKLKFPKREHAALQPAIDTLRSGKTEALALLAETFKDPNFGHVEPQNLEAVLKGFAVELWSDRSGRLFIVADEEDANRLMADGVGRGEIYTAAEARQVVQISDPGTVAEVHEWKRRFDGVIRDR